MRTTCDACTPTEAWESFDRCSQARLSTAPHDSLVPGVLAIGDLSDLAATIAPRPLRLEGLVDGSNRLLPEAGARDAYQPAVAAYKDAGQPMNFSVTVRSSGAAGWVRGHLSPSPD